MKSSLFLSLLFISLGCYATQQAAITPSREVVVGVPCEGCELVFQGMPAKLTSHAVIAAKDEPGERLHIEGEVRGRDGRLAPGVIVYAYHTDAEGIYPVDPESRHGRLRGWVKTDENGRYSFDTIRPAGYPNTNLPQHVHMHVIEVGRCTYYIDDILFEDDPRLTPKERVQPGRGGMGVTRPVRYANGWKVTRNIVLGEKIDGYERCNR